MRGALTGAPCAPRPVWLIAAGKAAVPMARAAADVLGSRLRGGLVVSPDNTVVSAPLTSMVGEHPQPGRGSEAAGRRALAASAGVDPDAELLVLLSGGASSLLAVPAGDVTLADKRSATGVLLRSGADIFALNTVRKHLSALKGGRLAAACRAACHALVLSDVVGDDLSVIGSGPTVADDTTFGDAWRVIEDVKAQMDRVRFLSVQKNHIRVLIVQHARIVDAITQNDVSEAEAAMRAHLREILKSMPAVAKARPELFNTAR